MDSQSTSIPIRSFGTPPSRFRSCNPNVALLLQPTLRNFGALAPVNHLDRNSYPQSRQKSPKSFAALLLPHLFPVTPLLHYSYKKMGGVGVCAFCIPMVCIGTPLPVGELVHVAPGFSLARFFGSRDRAALKGRRYTNPSPTCNSLSFNHLASFHVGPPHVSPLESSVCRKWG